MEARASSQHGDKRERVDGSSKIVSLQLSIVATQDLATPDAAIHVWSTAWRRPSTWVTHGKRSSRRAAESGALKSESFTAVAVAIAVQIVDVGADHHHRSFDLGWTVPTAARAVDVTGDWHTRPL